MLFTVVLPMMGGAIGLLPMRRWLPVEPGLKEILNVCLDA